MTVRPHNLKLAAAFAVAKSKHGVFRHAALIMRGRRLLAAASNDGARHAEVAAIFQAVGDPREPGDLRGADLLSIRVTRGGRLAMARPCAACMATLLTAGIRRVYYTGRDGTLRQEKVS